MKSTAASRKADREWNARWKTNYEAEREQIRQAAIAEADGDVHVWRIPCYVCGDAFCYYEAEYLALAQGASEESLVVGPQDPDCFRNSDGGRCLPQAGPNSVPCYYESQYPDGGGLGWGCCSCGAAWCHAMPGPGAWEQVR